MVKYLLNTLLIFLMLSSFSFAKGEDVQLKKEYGPDLTKVPFIIRFAYNEKYHQDWGKTYYSDRKDFLMDYEKDLAAQKLKAKQEAKAAAEKEKERLLEKKEALRKEKDRLKARLEKEKAEKKEEADRQKEFHSEVSGEQDEMQQMERDFSESRDSLRSGSR